MDIKSHLLQAILATLNSSPDTSFWQDPKYPYPAATPPNTGHSDILFSVPVHSMKLRYIIPSGGGVRLSYTP